jgi:O-antigen/teichoic acid export membrane protein
LKKLKPLTVYGLSIFSNAAISFATFSLLTHHLNEVDYGIINLYNSFILLLMPFISIGVPFVLNVDYFKMNEENYRNQFTSAMVIPIIAFVFFTLLSFIFYKYVQSVTKVNFFFTIAIPFTCLMFVLNDVMLNLFRNKEKYFLFAGFSFAKNILEVSITILLVLGLGFNWTGRLGSSIIALLFGSCILLYIIKRWHFISRKFSKSAMISVLLAGLPFIPERLAIFTLGYSDRFFIDHYNSTADVGFYSAGAQIALIVNLAILTLNNTFYPNLFRQLSETVMDYKGIKKNVWLFIGLSALITFIVIISVPFFFKFFIGHNFQPGKMYAINLAIGFFFWSIYNVFIVFLLNFKKNGLIMRISISGMMLSLILNFFLVPYYGAIGATYTSITVYFFMAFVTIFCVHNMYNLKRIV